MGIEICKVLVYYGHIAHSQFDHKCKRAVTMGCEGGTLTLVTNGLTKQIKNKNIKCPLVTITARSAVRRREG